MTDDCLSGEARSGGVSLKKLTREVSNRVSNTA